MNPCGGPSLRIRRTAIDTGYQAHHVYNYCRRRTDCLAVKGSATAQHIIGPAVKIDVNLAGKKVRRGAEVHLVGVSLAKLELYSFLRAKRPAEGQLPAGWCEFPQHDKEYFKGLTAEQVVLQKDRRGYKKRVWEKKRERNEQLDCRVYARAAAAIIGLDRWSKERWEQEIKRAGVVKPKPARKAKKRKGYLEGGESPWLGQ